MLAPSCAAVLLRWLRHAVPGLALLLAACAGTGEPRHQRLPDPMAFNLPVPPRKPPAPPLAEHDPRGFQVPVAFLGRTDFIWCVPYARAVTGVSLRGDAWTWWDGAEGRYARGQEPRPMAILALRRTGRLRLGHVAVVTRVLGPRSVLVTHANWGDSRDDRGKVHRAMRVADVSAANDWTAVRFLYPRTGKYGSVYPAHGFIYPDAGPVAQMAVAVPPG